jgi:hypothetical protein
MKDPIQASGTPANPQTGASLLAGVAMLAGIIVLVQGSLYYRAKSGTKLITMEKNKIQAQQAAEAGVENNIADIGSRRLRVTGSMVDSTTYTNKQVGAGTFTSRISALGMGASADTIQLLSTGMKGTGTSTVTAKLRLKKYIDTVLTPLSEITKDTSYTRFTVSVPDTNITTSVRNPNTMPPLNTTPAYDACMSSSAKKCDICHLTNSDVNTANVNSVSKPSIGTHIDHHGDYVTTDGTCDLYKPHKDTTITFHSHLDSTMAVVDRTTYDTVKTIDTLVRVKFLSWR